MQGANQCKLFWPNLENEVANGVMYHSSSSTLVLHNRPLKKGQTKVEIVKVIHGQGGVKVPFPTDEVSILSDAVGQFIAWHDHLVLPIMVSYHVLWFYTIFLLYKLL